ncbi:MAG: hypothetical protein SPF27_00275 [Methanobrevibacter boviskoreani]|nr:hypothetical protein [Methanobrevibacter boviskoreani]
MPELTWSNPPRRFSSVDLPDPDGPSITTNSPLSIVKFRSFTAFRTSSPFIYSFVTF